MQMQMERQNGWLDPDPTHGGKVPDIATVTVAARCGRRRKARPACREILTELYLQDTSLPSDVFFFLKTLQPPLALVACCLRTRRRLNHPTDPSSFVVPQQQSAACAHRSRIRR